MSVDLHFILKDQRELGVIVDRFFLRARSFTAALWNAASSRFPFIVCLGRWNENPSCFMIRPS